MKIRPYARIPRYAVIVVVISNRRRRRSCSVASCGLSCTLSFTWNVYITIMWWGSTSPQRLSVHASYTSSAEFKDARDKLAMSSIYTTASTTDWIVCYNLLNILSHLWLHHLAKLVYDAWYDPSKCSKCHLPPVPRDWPFLCYLYAIYTARAAYYNLPWLVSPRMPPSRVLNERSVQGWDGGKGRGTVLESPLRQVMCTRVT